MQIKECSCGGVMLPQFSYNPVAIDQADPVLQLENYFCSACKLKTVEPDVIIVTPVEILNFTMGLFKRLT